MQRFRGSKVLRINKFIFTDRDSLRNDKTKFYYFASLYKIDKNQLECLITADPVRIITSNVQIRIKFTTIYKKTAAWIDTEVFSSNKSWSKTLCNKKNLSLDFMEVQLNDRLHVKILPCVKLNKKDVEEFKLSLTIYEKE